MSLHWLCRVILLGCLLLPLPAASGEAPAGKTARGSVTWVHDGDTLQVAPFGKVRLIGIDCPERERSAERDRKFIALGAVPDRLRRSYHEALRFNIAQVKGRTVTLTFDDPRYDRHGRLLAYVELPDGRLLNRLLLEEGLAVVYRRFEFTRKEEFLAAEEGARQAGRGMWGSAGR